MAENQTTGYRSTEEIAADTLKRAKPQSLLDAAENAVIAFGMGWDMEGVMENLRAAVNREIGRG